jgi:hypothetical protein
LPNAPDGGGGLIVTTGEQTTGGTWIDCGDFWINVTSDGKNSPEWFARKMQFEGHLIQLEDGNKWMIPVARALRAGVGLPHLLVLGSKGELVSLPHPKYESICRKADAVWESFYTEIESGKQEIGAGSLSMAEIYDLCGEALNLNYRIGKWEASALRLFSDASMGKILAAIVDLPTIEEELKKKSVTDTPSGQEA